MLRAGEIINFPDQSWHLTCNLERNTVSWGGQGWDPENLTASGVSPPDNMPLGEPTSPCRDPVRRNQRPIIARATASSHDDS